MESAFLATYDECADGVFRYGYFRLFDRELARDLTQEAFMKTWREIAAGKQIQNIKAFVYKVMRNLIIDNSRKKKETSLDVMMETGFDVAFDTRKQIDAGIDVQEAVKLLEQLDEKYREVVLMRYIDGLTPREIAKIIDESENTISVRINRGIKQLRELMNHDR